MTPTRQTFRLAFRAQRNGLRGARECREAVRAKSGCGFSLATFSAIAADRTFRERAMRNTPADLCREAQEFRARQAARRRQSRVWAEMTRGL